MSELAAPTSGADKLQVKLKLLQERAVSASDWIVVADSDELNDYNMSIQVSKQSTARRMAGLGRAQRHPQTCGARHSEVHLLALAADCWPPLTAVPLHCLPQEYVVMLEAANATFGVGNMIDRQVLPHLSQAVYLPHFSPGSFLIRSTSHAYRNRRAH